MSEEKTQTVLALLKKNKSISEIAKELGLTRQGIDFILKKYISEHPEKIYKGDALYKKIVSPNEVLEARLTSLASTEYKKWENFLVLKKLKPKTYGFLSDYLAEALKSSIPIKIDDFLKKFGLAKEKKEEVLKLFSELYPERIILFKEYIISATKINILKLVDIAASLSANMEDMYSEFCKNESTRRILEKDGIKTIDDLHNRLKKRPLNSDKFIKTCDAKWEIKPSGKEDKDMEKLVLLSEKIADEFLCGFHLNLLIEKLKERTRKEIDQLALKTKLFASGKFRHCKGSLIVQNKCRKVLSTSDTIKEVLSETPMDLEEILNVLRKKGRDIKEQAARVALSNLKKSGIIELNDFIAVDENFKKKTGIERKRHFKKYSLKK